jgi:hypothetical protein
VALRLEQRRTLERLRTLLGERREKGAHPSSKSCAARNEKLTPAITRPRETIGTPAKPSNAGKGVSYATSA